MNTNTKGALVKFSPKAKTTIAVAATAAQDALYLLGEELGYMSAESDIAWKDALRKCKTREDRMMLRAGFEPAYMAARGVDKKSAQNRFDYLARLHSPETSRKAGHNERKAKAGRPEKSEVGSGKTLAPQETAQRLANVLHYIAKAQTKHAGDDEMLEVLGEIAAIAGGANV